MFYVYMFYYCGAFSLLCKMYLFHLFSIITQTSIVVSFSLLWDNVKNQAVNNMIQLLQ